MQPAPPRAVVGFLSALETRYAWACLPPLPHGNGHMGTSAVDRNSHDCAAYADLRRLWPETFPAIDVRLRTWLETECKYHDYVELQARLSIPSLPYSRTLAESHPDAPPVPRRLPFALCLADKAIGMRTIAVIAHLPALLFSISAVPARPG